MPLDRLVLILVIVLAAAMATVWLGAWIVASTALPLGWLMIVPLALAAYVLWRVVSDRTRKDDPYDRMDS